MRHASAALWIPVLLLLALGCQDNAGYDSDNEALMKQMPQYPGATFVARTKFTERFPEKSRALVYVHVTEDAPQEVATFYQQGLAAMGWALQPGGHDVTVVLSKGRAEVELNSPSTILEPNFVGKDEVERLAEVPPGATTIFSISANARVGSGANKAQDPRSLTSPPSP